MKLIDLFFCLLYRTQIELFNEDKKDSKLFAVVLMLVWSTTILYDCYVFLFDFYGLEELRREIPIRAIEIPLWGIFGIAWGLRYYKCKKTITQEFEERYREWHPDNRELCRMVSIVVWLAPFIILFLI